MNMKKLLSCLLFLPLLLFAFAEGRKTTDREEMKVKGKVKSIIETSYVTQPVSGIEKQHNVEWTKWTFNEQGNKTEEIRTEPYTGRVQQRLVFIYDSAGLLIEEKAYKSDSSLSHTYTFQYDKKGNRIEEFITEADGKLSTKYAYKFDSAGNKTEMMGYNMKIPNPHFLTETYAYDAHSNKIKETSEHSSGNHVTVYTYKYDSNGKITGLFVSEKHDRLGDSEYRETYKYDKAGNLVEKNYCSADGKVLDRSVFTYDAPGNWISQTTYELGKILLTRERKIEYYP